MRRAVFTLLLLGAGVAVAYFLNTRELRGSEPAPASSSERGVPSTPPAIPRAPVMVEDSTDGGVTDGGEPFYFDLGDLDFEAIREKTPDSLDWLMAAPTDDPEILEARARARDERNRQYGKVVSNTASVEEIHDYWTYRRKLSEDYIEVLQLILDEHGDELSERDRGLFELTISMHAARLAEIPSKLDDALQRKAEYDQAKKEWQQQKQRDPEGVP